MAQTMHILVLGMKRAHGSTHPVLLHVGIRKYYNLARADFQRGDCIDSEAPVYAILNKQDSTTYLGNLWGKPLHGYVHVFQKAAGGSPTASIMDGGATIATCTYGVRFPGYGLMGDCLRYGAKVSGITPDIYALYYPSPRVKSLALYGENRCCVELVNCPETSVTRSAGMQLYCATEALAILLAVDRANTYHASAGGGDTGRRFYRDWLWVSVRGF